MIDFTVRKENPLNKPIDLQEDMYLVQNMDIFSSEMDEEAVMMNLEKGEYYGINTVGSCIWKMLETPNTIITLCDQLRKQYAVPEQECRRDVTAFVTELLENNLVKISER